MKPLSLLSPPILISLLFLFLFSSSSPSLFPSASATNTTGPNWIGSFRPDGSCSLSSCCCITGVFTIDHTYTPSDGITITAFVSGNCMGTEKITDTTFPYPYTSYTFNPYIGGRNDIFALSEDNNSINQTDPTNSQCNSINYRTNGGNRMGQWKGEWPTAIALFSVFLGSAFSVFFN